MKHQCKEVDFTWKRVYKSGFREAILIEVTDVLRALSLLGGGRSKVEGPWQQKRGHLQFWNDQKGLTRGPKAVKRLM